MSSSGPACQPGVLVQISDPHFGTEQAPVVDALIEWLRAERPALIVLSGDITQRARRSQFARAHRFVSRLPAAQVLAIPGNHDIPLFNLVARLGWPYANYARCFGEQLEPEFESDRWLVLCVKTTRRLRHKDGEVSVAQVERVARRLRLARPDQLRVVVTHQPVHVIRAADIENLLHGYDMAVRRWADAGADIVMGGHIHLPYVRPLRESVRDLSRSVWAVQAGTAVSRRIREGVPNSVNVVRYSAGGSGCCHVERWDYSASARTFQEVESHRIDLDRNGV